MGKNKKTRKLKQTPQGKTLIELTQSKSSPALITISSTNQETSSKDLECVSQEDLSGSCEKVGSKKVQDFLEKRLGFEVCSEDTAQLTTTSTTTPKVDKSCSTREDQVDNNEVNAGSTAFNDTRLILIVGPDKFTEKLLIALEPSIDQNDVKLRSTQEFRMEDASKWRDESLASFLFVLDSLDEKALKSIDDTLDDLSRNYLLSMECIDFILAVEKQKSQEDRKNSIKPKDLLNFMKKYGRPIITVHFAKGWELDQDLTKKLQRFLKNRFAQPLPCE